MLLPFCAQGWGDRERIFWVLAVTLWGGLGSVVDSFLGGWLQASVVDKRTGKIVEGSGGQKVWCILLYVPFYFQCLGLYIPSALDKEKGHS